MMTGDYNLTAESIAHQIGIVLPDQPVTVITGDQLKTMAKADLK